jgi:hypothetical protein
LSAAERHRLATDLPGISLWLRSRLSDDPGRAVSPPDGRVRPGPPAGVLTCRRQVGKGLGPGRAVLFAFGQAPQDHRFEVFRDRAAQAGGSDCSRICCMQTATTVLPWKTGVPVSRK